MSRWVSFPDDNPYGTPRVPYLVNAVTERRLREGLAAHGVSVATIDLGGLESVQEFVQRTKDALDLPAWCGLGWDPLDDVIYDISEWWDFQMAIIFERFDEYLNRCPADALETMMNFEHYQSEFTRYELQLRCFYLGQDWPDGRFRTIADYPPA